jgi:epoxyqueuosine reductase QueG
MDIEKERFEQMKKKTGMARPGSTRYYRNAAKILSQFATSPNMREDTRRKLIDLSQSRDPKTREIAQRALRGIPYEED